MLGGSRHSLWAIFCQHLPVIGSGTLIGATAATPSPSDVASVRIGAVSAYATILIGVIATLIGIETLIDKVRSAHRRVLTLDCDVFVRGVDRELRAVLINPGRGTIRIRNIKVTNGAALIMPCPDLEIHPGSQFEWTVLAAHTPLPSLVIVHGEFDRADGSGWQFEAEFHITAGISEAKRLHLSKR